MNHESWVNIFIPFCKQIAIIYHRYGKKNMKHIEKHHV